MEMLTSFVEKAHLKTVDAVKMSLRGLPTLVSSGELFSCFYIGDFDDYATIIYENRNDKESHTCHKTGEDKDRTMVQDCEENEDFYDAITVEEPELSSTESDDEDYEEACCCFDQKDPFANSVERFWSNRREHDVIEPLHNDECNFEARLIDFGLKSAFEGLQFPFFEYGESLCDIISTRPRKHSRNRFRPYSTFGSQRDTSFYRSEEKLDEEKALKMILSKVSGKMQKKLKVDSSFLNQLHCGLNLQKIPRSKHKAQRVKFIMKAVGTKNILYYKNFKLALIQTGQRRLLNFLNRIEEETCLSDENYDCFVSPYNRKMKRPFEFFENTDENFIQTSQRIERSLQMNAFLGKICVETDKDVCQKNSYWWLQSFDLTDTKKITRDSKSQRKRSIDFKQKLQFEESIYLGSKYNSEYTTSSNSSFFGKVLLGTGFHQNLRTLCLLALFTFGGAENVFWTSKKTTGISLIQPDTAACLQYIGLCGWPKMKVGASLPPEVSTKIMYMTANQGEQALNSQPSCKPFRLLIIWDTSGGEDMFFFQQKRLILDLINKTECTDILLTTVGTTVKYLDINKTIANNSWMGKIGSHKPENLRNYIIPYSSISKAVFKFLTQVGSQKMAEEVFFVINEKTVIDNIGKVKEVLKYKKVFVVFFGMSPPPDVWTSVPTNRQHLIVLSDRSREKVTPAAEEILRLCFQGNFQLVQSRKVWTIVDLDLETGPVICSDLLDVSFCSGRNSDEWIENKRHMLCFKSYLLKLISLGWQTFAMHSYEYGLSKDAKVNTLKMLFRHNFLTRSLIEDYATMHFVYSYNSMTMSGVVTSDRLTRLLTTTRAHQPMIHVGF